jgi:hypothetical protein
LRRGAKPSFAATKHAAKRVKIRFALPVSLDGHTHVASNGFFLAGCHLIGPTAFPRRAARLGSGGRSRAGMMGWIRTPEGMAAIVAAILATNDRLVDPRSAAPCIL